MAWSVGYHSDFLEELNRESEPVQNAVFTAAQVLRIGGPLLGRPYVDTLKGSRYPNMKELRITLPDGEWRVAFVFDPARQAVLLAGASKSGISQTRFYDRLIRTADGRYAKHLQELSRKGEQR